MCVGATHWGQQVFYIHPTMDCAPGDKVNAKFTMVRKKENHRLLQIKMAVKVRGLGSGEGVKMP